MKIDKLTLVMLSAITLAIGMLIYNPIQQQQILNEIHHIVDENNFLIINETKTFQKQAHSDQLQRAAEHNNISKYIAGIEGNETVERHAISKALLDQNNAIMQEHQTLMNHLNPPNNTTTAKK